MDNCNTTSNQSVKGSYDPGWNDPPKFSYNAHQNTPGRPRNFLNKRVAFPLSNSSTPVPPPAVNLPPMPTLVTSALPIHSSAPNQSADVQVDSESILKEVRESLLQLLDSSSELGTKANDIKRRISIMEDMWTGGKLNNNIYLQMRDLALCLKNNEPNKADDIHRALMVDHVSEVSMWMPGIKQLIHNCIARCELLAIEAADDS